MHDADVSEPTTLLYVPAAHNAHPLGVRYEPAVQGGLVDVVDGDEESEAVPVVDGDALIELVEVEEGETELVEVEDRETDAVVVVDGDGLRDAVDVSDGLLLTDEVDVVEDEHDAQTASAVSEHSEAAAQGQAVQEVQAEEPVARLKVPATQAVHTREVDAAATSL